MRAVIVYESMYGNTLEIAEAVAAGLRTRADVIAVPVREADPARLAGADLVVVGGPTHAWGMSRSSTREQAISEGSRKGLRTAARRGDPGLREWLGNLSAGEFATAAFDTRIKAPAIATGRASRSIARRLRRHGLAVLAPPCSFFVSRENLLLAGETDRARRWGRELAERAAKRAAHLGKQA